METKAHLNPLLKLVLDLGPLLLFFLVNAKLGIFYATGTFMAAVLVALVVSYVLIKRLVRRNEGSWTVKQYNPAKTYTLSRREWQKAHLVIGKYNRAS